MAYNFKISEIKLEGRILKRKLKTVMVNNKTNLNNMNNYHQLPTATHKESLTTIYTST